MKCCVSVYFIETKLACYNVCSVYRQYGLDVMLEKTFQWNSGLWLQISKLSLTVSLSEVMDIGFENDNKSLLHPIASRKHCEAIDLEVSVGMSRRCYARHGKFNYLIASLGLCIYQVSLPTTNQPYPKPQTLWQKVFNMLKINVASTIYGSYLNVKCGAVCPQAG